MREVDIDRRRGLRSPETTTPITMDWRCARYILGGPGRNRTTDTRIFKTDAHFFAKVLAYQKQSHQGRTARRRFQNVQLPANSDEKCFQGSSTVVSGHKPECSWQDEGGHHAIVAEKTCCGPPIGWSTNRSRQLHSSYTGFFNMLILRQDQKPDQHPTSDDSRMS